MAANVLDSHYSRTHWRTALKKNSAMFKTVWFCLILTLCIVSGSASGQEQAPGQELVQYVRDAKKAGLKDTEIEINAVKAGWPAPMVKDAMNRLRGGANPAATAETPEPKAAEGKGTEPQGDKVDKAESSEKTAPSRAAQGSPESSPTQPPATPKFDSPAGGAPSSMAAPAGTPPAAASVKPANSPNEYRIGDGDVIQVSVWGERDASVGSIVVRPDGMITMPLIKDVKVSGLTPAEAEKSISELLSKVIKVPDVTVIVSQTNSKKVFMVGGGIKKEGPIPYTYRMTVMQALSEAGGLTDYAKRKKIYILRTENGRQFQFPFDYDAVLKGQRMELNIPLQPGDTLVVPNR